MTFVEQVHATGEEIDEIVARIDEAIGEDENVGHVIIALLSMVVVAQKPEITPPELAYTIQEVSKFLALVLADAESDKPLKTDIGLPNLTLN